MQHLLIDTNILLLLLIGSHDPKLIGRHRRTSLFTADDFKKLEEFRRTFGQCLTTSPLLTEASNLLGNDFHIAAAPMFKQTVLSMKNVVVSRDAVVSDRRFPRLGFADTYSLLAMDDQTVLLTDDVHLYLQALHSNSTAINFRHLNK